jgi:dihydroorotate dehydrogenase electron transfer subunit
MTPASSHRASARRRSDDPIRSAVGRGIPGFPVFALPVLSDAVLSITEEHEILLDPFSAYGAAGVAALRHNRRAVLIECNPVTAFFAEVLLRPASLPRLQWGFGDVGGACREQIAGLYATRCPQCGGQGVIERTELTGGRPVRILYRCACSPKRLSKEPDAADERAADRFSGLDIPFWHPASRPPARPSSPSFSADALPRRTTIALSVLWHAIERVPENTLRNALKAAFATSLESCIPSGSKGRCREINPWISFAAAFSRLYDIKKSTNRFLPGATIGRSFADLSAGRANVVILGRTPASPSGADIPDRSIDGTVSALPCSLADRADLTALQAAWLQKELDASGNIVTGLNRGGPPEERTDRILAAFHTVRRTAKAGSAGRFHLPDRGGLDLHSLVNLMEKSSLLPEGVRYRPNHPRGGYILSLQTGKPDSAARPMVAEQDLLQKLAAAARGRFAIHGSSVSVQTVLHAFYQTLNEAEISTVSKYAVEDLLAKAVASFALFRRGRLALRKGKSRPAGSRAALASARRAVRNAELLSENSGGADRMVWEKAIRRLSGDSLTLEDAAFLRVKIRPAEIERRRKEHAAGLLRGWGRALGYAVRRPQGRPADILWRTSSGRAFTFSPGKHGVRVAGRSKGGSAVAWGSLPYPALDRAVAAWMSRRPEKKGEFSESPILSENTSQAEGDSQAEITPAGDLRLKVVQNRVLCAEHYLMTVDLPKGVELQFTPGQFFHMVCDPGAEKRLPYPLTLRRPFSIHRARFPGFDPAALSWTGDLPEELLASLIRHPSRIEFLYRVAGEGTEQLSRVRKGTVLDAIGPCGSGFASSEERTAVIVAGGIGIAPLAALAEELRFRGKEVLVYVGAVGKDMLGLAATRGGSCDEGDLVGAIETEFREIGARVMTVCTDDGSAGERGLVTEMLEAGIREGCVPRENVRLYACGPKGMLRATAAVAASHGLDCRVSLEERMACGVGACYSCTVSVRQPDGTEAKKRVCREGPVFDAREIVWKD